MSGVQGMWEAGNTIQTLFPDKLSTSISEARQPSGPLCLVSIWPCLSLTFIFIFLICHLIWLESLATVSLTHSCKGLIEALICTASSVANHRVKNYPSGHLLSNKVYMAELREDMTTHPEVRQGGET